MANTLRVKRRATGGAAGAPATLKNAELAHNEVDDILYIGKGDSGGDATSIVPVGGLGAFVSLTGAQTVAGVKTFSSSPLVPDASTTGQAASKGQMDTALAPKAPLASPTLTGTPAAPTAATGTNTTQIATTAWVTNEKGINNGIASLDGTGKVPSAQLPSGLTGAMAYQGAWNASTNSPTLPAAGSGNTGHVYTVSVAGATSIDGITDWKVGDNVVSNGTVWEKWDHTDAVTSVANRTGAVTLSTADISGLGTIATQAANSVNITGGIVDGVTLDGGTF